MNHSQTLITRCLRNERRAYEELVAAYQRSVVNVIYRIVNERETAIELAQEVFMKVFASLDRYDMNRSLTTWILRIAVNHAIDYRRKQQNNPLVFTDDDNESSDLAVDQQNPLTLLESRERSILIQQGLAQLPDQYRLPIWLHFHEELSYQEVTEVLQIPLTTLKIRMHRGLKKLAELLQRYQEHQYEL